MSEDRRSWWDFDPDERPVPLGPIAEAVATEAEEIVESQRQSIMRENTDPTGETLAALREAAATAPVDGGLDRAPASLRRVAVALLSVACVAMFSLGWVQGGARAEARVSPADRVMPPTTKDAQADSNERLGARRHIGLRSKEVSKP